MNELKKSLSSMSIFNAFFEKPELIKNGKFEIETDFTEDELDKIFNTFKNQFEEHPLTLKQFNECIEVICNELLLKFKDERMKEKFLHFYTNTQYHKEVVWGLYVLAITKKEKASKTIPFNI